MKRKQVKHNILTMTLIIFSVIVVLMNIYLVFDNVFWTDEVFTIDLVHKSFLQGIQETAQDVHPPLYYIILKVMCIILGYRGFVYHLTSVIPLMITAVMANTVYKKKFGYFASYVLLIFCGLSQAGATYNIEVRMYSWATLFVCCSFLQVYFILKYNRCKDWILFTVFALASAYTHYYAMLIVFIMAFIIYAIQLLRFKMRVIKYIGISIGIAIAGYLPWLSVLMVSFKNVTNDYWMQSYPDIKTCFRAIFGDNSISIKIAFGIAIALAFLIIVKIITLKKEKAEKATDERFYLICVGMFTILGTVFLSELISKLLRPMLQTRYMVPMIGIAAICVALTVEQYICFIKKYKYICEFLKIVSVIILTFFYFRGGYLFVERQYITQKENTQDAIELLDDNKLMENKVLLSQARMVMEYYYPYADMVKYDEENLEECIHEKDNITLLLDKDTWNSQLEEKIISSGYEVQNYGVIHLGEEEYDVYSLNNDM